MTNRKIIQLALLVSMAGVLHFIETILPIPLPIPGFKLGLANIITLFVIVVYGLREALLVSFLRTTLGTLMAGSLFSLPFLMGLAGAVAACLIMYVVFHRLTPLFSLIGVSILGAVGHNAMQLLIAMAVLNLADLIFYFPYLVLFAVGTGTVTGLIIAGVLRKLPLALWGVPLPKI
jgi:heptaprenyl diphosphate synthase